MLELSYPKFGVNSWRQLRGIGLAFEYRSEDSDRKHSKKMIELVIVVAVFCVAVGCIVFALNPYRTTNLVFAVISALVAAWLASVAAVVVRAGTVAAPDTVFTFLLRANAVIGAYFPWAAWMLKESLVASSLRGLVITSRRWFLVCLGLSLLSFSDSFIFYAGTPLVTERGWAYVVYTLVGIILYINLIVGSLKGMREQAGVRLLETKFLVLALCVACLMIVLFTSIGNLLRIPILKKLSVVVFMISYMLTAWSIYLYKIYDSRALMLALAQRIFITIVAGVEMLVVWVLLSERIGHGSAVAVGVVALALSIFWVDARTREWLDLDGRKEAERAREIIIATAQTESNRVFLKASYSAIFSKMFLADRVHLEAASEEGVGASMLGMREDAFLELLDLGWVTTESLERRRSTYARRGLYDYLVCNDVGVMVAVSAFKRKPSFIVKLGKKTDRWPYTYTEIQKLRALAELVDNILAHARLMEQAAIKGRLEHMEFIARGLAHDIKNLLTPISTFLLSAEACIAANGSVRDAFKAAEQSIGTMSEYLKEVSAHASPLAARRIMVNVKDVAEKVVQVNSVIAAERNVALLCQMPEGLEIYADPTLMNRLISNIVVNAIEAVADGGVVKLGGSRDVTGNLKIVIEDNGCGMTPELQEKIFDPYFTTKQSGDRALGAGIGLTICQKIVQSHGGTMKIDSKAKDGTRVTVMLPRGWVESPATGELCAKPI